jgi:hypothetical protein
MDELIKRITEKTGISEDQARSFISIDYSSPPAS